MAYLEVAQALAAEREISMVQAASFPSANKRLPKVKLDDLQRRARAAHTVKARPRARSGWDMLRQLSGGPQKKGKRRG